MNIYQNPYINPYGFGQGYSQTPQTAPSVQIVKVNGENGARSYNVGPNSSALLLDESGLMVWLVTSDGAGYKTVSAYDITPHQAEKAPDYGALETRIARLEEIINGNSRNFTAVSKKQPTDAGRKADARNGERRSEPPNYD